MSPSESLIAWHGNWSLSRATVTCKSCKATQSELDRESDFPHTTTCSRVALTRKRPWDELDEIRHALPPYT